jgi:ribosomal protein L37AE/L43A
LIIKCPVCRGLQVGRVGSDQYYCWNCYLEFNFSRGQVNLFEVAEDGSLMATERPSGLL